MIVRDPCILPREWVLLGRPEVTLGVGCIETLGADPGDRFDLVLVILYSAARAE